MRISTPGVFNFFFLLAGYSGGLNQGVSGGLNQGVSWE